VLRTSTALDAADVARAYKSLWRVERTFRETKSTLEVAGPSFHHRDDTTVGHIVGCFLALRLEVRPAAPARDERGVEVAWPDLMRDLAEVKAVEIALDGQHYRLRTDPRAARSSLRAAGVRPPSVVTPLGAASQPLPQERSPCSAKVPLASQLRGIMKLVRSDCRKSVRMRNISWTASPRSGRRIRNGTRHKSDRKSTRS